MDRCEILWCLGRFGEFLGDREANCLVDLFAAPVKPSSIQPSNAPQPMDGISRIGHLPTEASLRSTSQAQSCLTILPYELLLEIFNNLEFVSSFRLSLVSERL